MRLTTLIITLALFSPFCLAESGVDIGADASKDQKTSVNSKISREKSMSISQDQKSSRRTGTEKSRENRRETSRSRTHRSGVDKSTKTDITYSLSGTSLLISALSALEKTDPDFAYCKILSNSSHSKFPFVIWHDGTIGWSDRMRLSEREELQLTIPTWVVTDIHPDFEELRRYFGCWIWYAELLAGSIDELAKFGVFHSEAEVRRTATAIIKRNAQRRDILNQAFRQINEIEACNIPTIQGARDPAKILIQCGSVEIRPREGIATINGSPLFSADSIQSRRFDVVIAASDSSHNGTEATQEARDSSSSSSRNFSSAEHSQESGRSLSFRKSEGSDQSISSDDDIRSNESFKATPE